MGSLIKLAAWALIEFGRAGSVRAASVRLAAVALCAAFAIAVTLAALGCVAAALWLFALPGIGPVGAPLVVAGFLSVVTVALVLAAWLVMRPGPARPGANAGPQLLLSEAARLFNEHKGAVLLAAALAGMAAANGGHKP